MGGEQSGGPEIRLARSVDGGGTFSTSLVVDRNSCPCCRTSIATAPDGSLYVAWRKILPEGVRDIVVARAGPDDTSFGEPVRVHSDGWVFDGCPHAGPSLAIDSNGWLHVGWYTGRETRQGVWSAVSQDGAHTFSEPVSLLTADWVPASQVALAHSSDGLLAAWEDRTVEGGAVVLANSATTSASPPTPFFRAAGRLPAIDGNAGRALFAWLDGESIRVVWTD
jgi:hypothetical protein